MHLQMALLDSFYPLLRPILFRFDAETAHSITVKLLKTSHLLGLLGSPPTSYPPSSRTVMGLSFPNLVGLAAGMDKSASAVDAWSALGFGSVEVGTLTPRPQPGNPQPRLFRLIPHQAIINRMGFNNPGIDFAVAKLSHRQNKNNTIIGVNIGKNFDTPNDQAEEDYLTCLRKAYHVADYIVVNISSPNTKGLRDLQAEEPIRRLINALTKEKDILTAQHGKSVPLLVKIAPDLEPDQINSLARVFTEFNLSGVIATNTTISRDAVKDHPLASETGGLSGAPVRQRSTEVISALRQQLPESIPIIGVGGILSADDAKQKLNAGASLVQLYSGLVYRGPTLVREIAAINHSE